MNYFQIMAYTNIVLCILVVILIIISIIKMVSSNNEELNKITMSNYEIERILLEIKNKLDK